MDKLREVNLRPYGKGKGPAFVLTLWDTGRTDWRGQSYIRYRLQEGEPLSSRKRTIFEGEDFAGSPMSADDSDDSVRSLLVFLTLRPGDTDVDYFAEYTPEQLAFRDAHAEALSFEAYCRFDPEAKREARKARG